MNTNIIETPEVKKLTFSSDSQPCKKTIEVPNPYFCKHGPTYCKATHQYVICVVNAQDIKEIGLSTFANNGIVVISEPCTEQEFNEAFEDVLSKIQNQSL